MDVQVNWLGILLATVSSMVVGFIWYAGPVFGNKWAKLVGLNLNDPKIQKDAGRAIGITILVSFVTAYVLAHVSFLSNAFFNNFFFQDAVTTAFWLWLGFTATRIITHDVFERRPSALTFLTVAHEFVTLMVMGVIIGLFQP